jgi:hypothetical protein
MSRDPSLVPASWHGIKDYLLMEMRTSRPIRTVIYPSNRTSVHGGLCAYRLVLEAPLILNLQAQAFTQVGRDHWGRYLGK